MRGLADAVRMASANPARMPGLPQAAGFALGARADIAVMGEEAGGLAVEQVLVAGLPV